MEDLSKDMKPKKAVSPKMKALLDKEKMAARKRIIERGIVHFRADEEFMIALLEASERLKVAPGTLCRRIVWENLQAMKTTNTKCAREATNAPESPESLLLKLADEIRSGQDTLLAELNDIRSQLLGRKKRDQTK